MDGKQARRTGNSSPLGLIFDHGCDAFSTGLQCMIVSKFMLLGDSIYSVLFVGLSCLIFHVSTLEEYYTGGLFLQVGNAISDGCLPLILTKIYFALYGNLFLKDIAFQKNHWYQGSPELLKVDLFSAFACFVQSSNVLMILKNILDQRFKSTSAGYCEPVILKDLAIQLIGYLLTPILTTALALRSATPNYFILILLQSFVM